jgi:hypothetical protein
MRDSNLKILDFNLQENKFLYLSKDENNREINIFLLQDIQFTGDNLFYPNILGYSHKNNRIYSLIKEKIMSLEKIKKDNIFTNEIKNIEKKCTQPLFYFIYNTDNYFHFIYDSLPYLISYFSLKKQIPNIKLLMNYPNQEKKQFYKFVEEFLQILKIEKHDIVMVDSDTVYSNIYVSNSYTHDFDSNLPPRKEIYDFYKKISDQVIDNHDLPKKIYISRRTWLNKDHSNIGTNYTTRRKLINEDDLVNMLNKYGYEEIFTENLSTKEKIALFKNATNVIGAFGGGICNVLFSKPQCQLIAIESPGFLDINQRFLFSLKNIDLKIFKDTNHYEKTKYKKYMRVKYNSIIGEIIEVDGDYITIAYTDNFIAGWNADLNYKNIRVKSELCQLLDNGLNSSWELNIKNLEKILN